MCRFSAKTLFEQPIIEGLEYMLRLDDNSLINQPIRYDLFRWMKHNHVSYGFRSRQRDNPLYIKGLWEATWTYIKQFNITPVVFQKWPKRVCFFNNFELSELSFWQSQEYRHYVDYVDKLGGIYYYRWGDAPIKTIGVSLFMRNGNLHWFKDINYTHKVITDNMSAAIAKGKSTYLSIA